MCTPFFPASLFSIGSNVADEICQWLMITDKLSILKLMFSLTFAHITQTHCLCVTALKTILDCFLWLYHYFRRKIYFLLFFFLNKCTIIQLDIFGMFGKNNLTLLTLMDFNISTFLVYLCNLCNMLLFCLN